MLIGPDEWNLWVPTSYHDYEVVKIDDLKFFVCPLTYITRRSWELLDLVNETTNLETGQVAFLPCPGSYLEQPGWYREAVQIKRGERGSEWFSDEMKKRCERDNGRER